MKTVPIKQSLMTAEHPVVLSVFHLGENSTPPPFEGFLAGLIIRLTETDAQEKIKVLIHGHGEFTEAWEV